MNELHSFLFEDHQIRGALVRLNETWQQVVAQHVYPSDVEALLGESVAATVLMASGLKIQPRVSLQLQGEGALKLLLVQCADELRVRGMAHWRSHAGSESLLDNGRLAVHLDVGGRHGVQQGIVPLVGPKLEDCLEAYFRQSEQLSTRLVLGAGPDAATGLLIQALPSREGAHADFETVARHARAIDPAELNAARVDDWLERAFPEYRIRLFEPRTVLHDCRCTPEHLAGVVRMLGEEELASILDDEGVVELTCEFCNRVFRYEDADVDAVLRGESPEMTLH